MRVAYVNGRYLRHRDASVHVEDRGFQFADGVYEVIAVIDGRLVDRDGHVDRLERSMAAIGLAPRVERRVLVLVINEVARRNRLTNGLIYLQVTRGTAPRDFPFPNPARRSTLVITAKPVADIRREGLAADGIAVITIPDVRWRRRDIKTVALVPQVLGKQRAHDAGAYEAWQVEDDGLVTEGCSSNAFIVTADGRLVTRPPSPAILNGITRLSVLDLAARERVPVEPRPFTVAEAKAAAEAFLTSASHVVVPVVRIDDTVIGDGRPGPLTRRLRAAYLEAAAAEPRAVGR